MEMEEEKSNHAQVVATDEVKTLGVEKLPLVKTRKIEPGTQSYTNTADIRAYYFYSPKLGFHPCPCVGKVTKGYAPDRVYLYAIPVSCIEIFADFSITNNPRQRNYIEEVRELIIADPISFLQIGTSEARIIKYIMMSLDEDKNSEMIKNDLLQQLGVGRGVARQPSSPDALADASVCRSLDEILDMGYEWAYDEIKTGAMFPPIKTERYYVTSWMPMDVLYRVRGLKGTSTDYATIDNINIETAYYTTMLIGNKNVFVYSPSEEKMKITMDSDIKLLKFKGLIRIKLIEKDETTSE